MSGVCVCVDGNTCAQNTHVYTQALAGRHVPRTADSPKDGHNLFYNRLVSAQVENVTTYLCWQDAIPESAINRRGLTALPSARRAPSTSTPPTPPPPPPRASRLPPTSLSLHPSLGSSLLIVVSGGFSLDSVTHQQFGLQVLHLNPPRGSEPDFLFQVSWDAAASSQSWRPNWRRLLIFILKVILFLLYRCIRELSIKSWVLWFYQQHSQV